MCNGIQDYHEIACGNPTQVAALKFNRWGYTRNIAGSNLFLVLKLIGESLVKV